MALGDRRGTRNRRKWVMFPLRRRWFIALPMLAVVVLMTLPLRLLLSDHHSHWTGRDPLLQKSWVNTTKYSTTTTHQLQDDVPNKKNNKVPSEETNLIIDILSIGSKTRPDLQDAQQATFGSHPSVRSFVKATEEDDVEADCHTTLQKRDAFAIAKYCHGLKDRLNDNSNLWEPLQKMTVHFATRKWLAKKEHPAGWMCAQKRPADAFNKLLQKYQENVNLPDYLAIVDDDTYLNMPAVANQLRQDFSGANKEALAIAGCMIRSRLYEHNFTHPFGGFGMFFNRPALENFMKPLHCSERERDSETMDSLHGGFEQLACWRLQQNSVGEQEIFRDGMSVADLMQAYSSHWPYLKHRDWNGPGYCLHSDWMWGVFSNYYPVSDHTTDASFASVPQDRMRAYKGSTIYAGRQTRAVLAARKECDHKADACVSDSHLCHYVSPEQMKILYRQHS